MRVGYTTGVFDLFHVGHVNLLKNASALCDKLIVGVSTDDLVSYKHKSAVIPFEQRLEVVRSCRYVDVVVPQETMNKVEACKKLKFNVMFVGDDWYGEERWKSYEEQLSSMGVEIVFLPYTKGTSSTLINQVLQDLRG